MKLYLARHTETNYNVEGLCNADPSVDVHLTMHGIEQAKHLSQKLAGEDIEVIYISELPRTRRTAEFVNLYHNVPLIVDPRINENISGFESKPVRDFIDALEKSSDKRQASFNDGESLEMVCKRVENFLMTLKATGQSSVLVITHAYIIECIHGILNKSPDYYSAGYMIDQGDYDTFEI